MHQKSKESKFFWYSSMGDTHSLHSFLQAHHCYRMFLHTAHREVYYLTEEGIPWLVSIRAHNKSHVPLLLTAWVLQSVGPWGWQGITTEVSRESAYAQPLPNAQHQHHHLPHLFCINATVFFQVPLVKQQ